MRWTLRSRASLPFQHHSLSRGNVSLSLLRNATATTPWIEPRTKTTSTRSSTRSHHTPSPHPHSHPTSPSTFTRLLKSNPTLNPHDYTSGHWLLDNKRKHSLRHIAFDFSALCQNVQALCPENGPIVRCEKLEGGYNRVFVFGLEDGRSVIARLPFAAAGRKEVLVGAEVATVAFLQSKTRLPVPHIIDWSDDASNPIGSEYIIMDCVPGLQLHQAWPEMNGVQQLKCIRSIYESLKEVVNVTFPAYWSIYFKGRVKSSVARDLDDGFVIGPHCDARYYWDSGIKPSDGGGLSSMGNRGPWDNFDSFCDGLVDAGLSRLPGPDMSIRKRPSYHGSVQDHIELLDHTRRLLHAMAADPRIQQSTTPTLFHPDLHKRNIFVSREDPTIITGFIDWQSASIEPAFWYADEVPDFATPRNQTQAQTQSRSPDDEKRARNEHLCSQAFDALTRLQLPRIGHPRSLDANLFRPFRYTHNTWTHGAISLRHDLIQTARHWTALGFVGVCPYAIPTDEELATHLKAYEFFKDVVQLKALVQEGLNVPSDGWVPTEAWEVTQQVHGELFDEFLRTVITSADEDEPIRTEEDARMVWPFDIDIDVAAD